VPCDIPYLEIANLKTTLGANKMILCKAPTRTKHFPEFSLLANLRFACLRAGAEVSQNQNVQRRSAELLRHLVAHQPSPEFSQQYMYRAGELGEGLVLKVNHDMNCVMINRVNAENVTRLASIVINVRKGEQQ
jgi:hypothetical protein